MFNLYLTYHGRAIGAFLCYRACDAAAHIKWAAMRRGVSAHVIDYRIVKL